MKAIFLSKAGVKKDAPVSLSPEVFSATPNPKLIQLAYESYLANKRAGGAKVLSRGEVRGGGRKPWRQKGTGRARIGTIRAPHWRGGGITFGPTGNANYSIGLSQTAKRQALRQALSAKAKDNSIMILESFENADGKVNTTIKLLQKIGITGQVLLVVGQKDALIDRATRNITGVKASSAMYLNVFDVINADQIIVTKDALERIYQWLGASSTVAMETANV